MRILFLHKRFYMHKDLINDRYGRFYEIPDYLAKRGHQIRLVCHSYRNTETSGLTVQGNFSINSFKLEWNPLSGFIRHYYRLVEMVRKDRPDVIIAGSDCYQIIIGAALARRYAIPFIADMYDNFAWYKASRIPGVLSLFARALAQASAVTAVSDALMDLVKEKYLPFGKLYLIENAVSKNFLAHHQRDLARAVLGFESDRIYIGTAGDLSAEKGLEQLLNAFKAIAGKNHIFTLVLAGKISGNLDIPSADNIRYLGELSHEQIPLLFSALDMGVICVRDNEFGRYCFPQKFYEMVACGLPLVASRVGEMARLLDRYPDQLFKPDDVNDMQRAIRYQLQHRLALPVEVPTWEMQAQKFEQIIEAVIPS
jgi:teichuronic acid biosynthesis glycosyltransferase TuaC